MRYLDDILMVLGIASLTAGGFFISLPVGCFVLGVCLIGAAYLVAKGGDHD